MSRVTKSATRINTYRECEAKYGYKYICKIPQPDTPATEEGKLIHNQLESYYRGGPIPTHPAARALLRLLPSPGPEIKPEVEIRAEWMGHEWVAFVDLLQMHDRHAIVRDHKTTSNLRWAKTPLELHTDPQSVIYAGLAFQEFGAEKVTANWNYVTRGKRNNTRGVSLTVINNEDWLEQCVKPIIETADAIDQISPNPEDWNRNTDSCGNFGGCPYAGKPCQPKRRIGKALMSTVKKMSFAERIAAKKAAAAAQSETETAPAQEVNPAPRQVTNVTKTEKAPTKGGADAVREALHVLADALADRLSS